MKFSVLSIQSYERFIKENDARIFIPQSPEFVRVRTRQGEKIQCVGVTSDDGSCILAAGVLSYQPWKGFFRKARLVYGPTLDWENDALIRAFFEGIKEHLHKDRKVLSLDFSPLLPRAFYDDITEVSVNEIATQAVSTLKKMGATRLNKEFYERPDIQIRFIYTKALGPNGTDFETALTGLAKGLRRRFRNEGRYGVITRFLPPEEFDVFEGLHESTRERQEMNGISASSRALYTELMRELGPERSFLCVAFFSPLLYLEQINEEREATKARLAAVEARKTTKASLRQIQEEKDKLSVLDHNEAQCREHIEKYGDKEVPFNAALSFLFGKELILLLGGMDKRFVAYARDYPVERAMFKWACDNGISLYNTFGISGIFDESAPDASVLDFKRWLRGNVEEFVGTFVLPIRPRLASLLGALD